MKKIIPIGIAIISVIAIISLFVVKGLEKEQPIPANNVQNKEQPENKDNQAVPEVTSDVKEKNPIGQVANIGESVSSANKTEGLENTYINREAGYQIDVPKSWNGYVTSKIIAGPSVQVAFGFAGQNPSDFYEMMILSERPKSIYESSNKEGSGLIYVGEVPKNKSVILCTGGCCSGTILNVKFDSFHKDRCKEVPEILKTFKAL